LRSLCDVSNSLEQAAVVEDSAVAVAADGGERAFVVVAEAAVVDVVSVSDRTADSSAPDLTGRCVPQASHCRRRARLSSVQTPHVHVLKPIILIDSFGAAMTFNAYQKAGFRWQKLDVAGVF